MKQFIIFFESVALALGLVGRVYGQGTIVFNNLGTNDGLVRITYRLSNRNVLMNQDLNFELLAGPVGRPLQFIHRWLLRDGSAKGINVAPGRFADPKGSVFTVPGATPGSGVDIEVRAWAGNYTDYHSAQFAQAGSGDTRFAISTGSTEKPPASMNLPMLNIYGVAEPVISPVLGIGWSNRLPQLTFTGNVGNSYALGYISALAASNQWQTLLNQSHWVLTNNP